MISQTPYHPLPPYISPDSQLGKKPAPRPRQIVISDSTTAVPPETDQAFPMHINKFAIDRLDGEIEDKLEQVEFYDSEEGSGHSSGMHDSRELKLTHIIV